MEENADIASTAAALTLNELIPAVEKFLAGLEVCSTFLGITKEKLKSMHGTGKMALEKDKKKMYYTMMTEKSTQLNSHCEMFVARSDLIHNNLQGLPDDVCSDNYVDTWFDQVKQDFADTNKETWAQIQRPVLAITDKGRKSRKS